MVVNIQTELISFEPDNIGTVTWAGGAQTIKRYLIPCRPTIDWLKVNQYNLNAVAVGVPVGGQPKPLGALRLGIYRCVYPPKPASASGFVVAELIKGSTYSITTLGSLLPITIGLPDMDSTVLTLGGCFWIVLQLEDNTSSGTSHMAFTIDGATASDTNLEHMWFLGTGTAGALPATILINTLTNTDQMPCVRADWQ